MDTGRYAYNLYSSDSPLGMLNIYTNRAFTLEGLLEISFQTIPELKPVHSRRH